MRAHISVLRANNLIDEKEFDEARQLLNEAETLIQPYAKHVDGIYVFVELLLAKGRAYYSETLYTLALNCFLRAEFAYSTYNGQSKNMIELFGLDKLVDITDKKMQEKWNLNSLNRLIQVSLFTCYVMKNNDPAMVQYAIPSLLAKVELAYINGEKCTALAVAIKILDLVDIFISNHYFRQADHLLSVAAYNLDKERNFAGKNEEKRRELNRLQCLICNKYAWYGHLLLKGSMMYHDITEKANYGVPVTCDEKRKMNIQMECTRLTKLVGEGFVAFEDQMPHVYVTDPDEIKEVIETTKTWIREGHRLAEAQDDRAKFICIMEDVLDIERKMKTMTSSGSVKTAVSQHRIVKFQ